MEQQIRKNLANNLKEERQKRKLTQKQLSKLANVPINDIIKIENQKILPSIYVIMRLAQVLNIKVHTLLTRIKIR